MGDRWTVYHDFFRVFFEVADDRCRAYWGSPKPNGQAASLQLLEEFIEVVNNPDAVVIDAGAGATSAVLRSHFKHVISCDPDESYLGFVRKACEKMGLNPGAWVHGVPTELADACFYDYGTNERIPLMSRFVDLTRTLFWVDDAHDNDVHRRAVELMIGRAKFIEVSKMDQYKRYGVFGRLA